MAGLTQDQPQRPLHPPPPPPSSAPPVFLHGVGSHCCLRVSSCGGFQLGVQLQSHTAVRAGLLVPALRRGVMNSRGSFWPRYPRLTGHDHVIHTQTRNSPGRIWLLLIQPLKGCSVFVQAAAEPALALNVSPFLKRSCTLPGSDCVSVQHGSFSCFKFMLHKSKNP